MTVYKSLQNGAFQSLDERRKKAIIMLFEDRLTDEEIAKTVNRSRQTLAKWKKNKIFIKAQQEYRHIALDNYVPDAIKQLHHLSLNARSEMVRLQANTTILTMAGFGSIDGTNELQNAQVRKANAEARIAEYQADQLEGKGETNPLLIGIQEAIVKDNEKGDDSDANVVEDS